MTDTEEITCRHRPECDGCPLFEMSPEASRQYKYEALTESFQSYRERYAWHAPQVAASPHSLGYRNRARMVVTAESELGFYRSGSREVLAIEKCLVHDARLERILEQLREFAGLDEAAFVDIRVDPRSRKAIVAFVMRVAPDDKWKLAAVEHLSKLAGPESISVHLEILGRNDAIGSGKTEVLAGEPTLSMHVGDHAFEVSNDAFFQVNVGVLENIHRMVRESVSHATTLLDAYCGVGVHGIACAPAGAEITGFDSVDVAIDLARRNAARAGVAADFRLSDDQSADLKNFDAAIMNPARAGISQQFIAKLSSQEIPRIVYISCEPKSLLRDSERLAQAGYQLDQIAAFDMMPRTEHVELVAVFSRSDRRTFAPIEGFSGVSGPAADDEWLAVVEGSVPRNATLPGALGKIERLRRCGSDSVVRLLTTDVESTRLRETLRAWGHPIIGDDDFGNPAANHRYAGEFALDRLALHRYRSGQETEVASAHLVSIFRLPDKVLYPSGRGDDV